MTERTTWHPSRRCWTAGITALCLFVWHADTRAAIVYDSLAQNLYTGGAGYLLTSDSGQAVTLAGTERAVTQVEVYLRSTAAESFRLRLYEFDSGSSQPGALIWESPIQVFPYSTPPPSSQRKIVSVAVPNVAVPDTLVWAIAPDAPATSSFIVLNADLPTVGSNHDFWFKSSVDGSWTSTTSSSFGRGARITAVPVPEPSTIVLIGIGTVLVLLHRIARTMSWQQKLLLCRCAAQC